MIATASASEVYGDAELHIPLRAGAEDWVKPQADVRSGEQSPKCAASLVAGRICEHGVVQDVEDFPLEFCGKALAELEAFENAHVQL